MKRKLRPEKGGGQFPADIDRELVKALAGTRIHCAYRKKMIRRTKSHEKRSLYTMGIYGMIIISLKWRFWEAVTRQF